MREDSASRRPPAFGRPGRILLRAALYSWSVAAAVLILLIVYETLAPPGLRPLSRIFAHRENLRMPGWVAAEQALPLLPPCRRVTVDSDDQVFFFALRYRAYPTWILWPREGAQAAEADSISCRVYFHDGVLRIEEARVE